jgi:V/A-type H+-transporting ATPase subunit A
MSEATMAEPETLRMASVDAAAARITRISGALVEARPMSGAALYELASIGEARLLGEVVRLRGDLGTLQVYEETTGLRVGEPVALTGRPLEVHLGPGLLGAILDGVARPLERVAAVMGDFIQPGSTSPTLDADRFWDFVPRIAAGATVSGGDILGSVQEAAKFEHRILVPPGVSGVVADIRAGRFTIRDPIGFLEDGTPLLLATQWPVRRARPIRRRLPSDRPFVTGQRVLDFLFPAAEGGSVALPGGFGTGKTVVEQSLAKHGEADVIVYVGCGERGNEMAEVLHEFPQLEDPRTGGSIMDRTVLIANTSNMPVAAREASIYLGVTIAEYFRDMGYRVAMLADSISRWAEALREMGSRLQEMPGEEGYPTYLGSRLGSVYERAGRVATTGTPERVGALTLIAAVSPPGGDLSEPVTQASLRVAGALWALDAALAHRRHFPAIDWETSYSLYTEPTDRWFIENAGEDWPDLRRATLELLRQERDLAEIAGLIGVDAMQDRERFVLTAAKMLRDVVLAQSAFETNDRVSSVARTYRLVSLIHEFVRAANHAIARGTPLAELPLDAVRDALMALRLSAEAGLDTQTTAVRDVIRRMGAQGQEAAADIVQAGEERT